MAEFFRHNWAMFAMIYGSCFIFIIWLILKRKDLNMKPWEVIVVGVVGETYGLFTPVFFAWMEVGFVISKAANFRIFGPAIFLSLYFLLVLKIKKIPLRYGMDIFAICVPIVLTFGRAVCFIHGCCYGTYIPGTNFRWPIREIEIAFEIIFLIIFAPRVYKGKTEGEVYPIYLICFGAIRFILEFFRSEYLPPEGTWHLAHTWALLFTIIGVIWLLFIKFNIIDYFKNQYHAPAKKK